MLDWPEALIIGVSIVLLAGIVGATILAVWRTVLWLEWRYGDHAHWRWEILDVLVQRRATGAYVDQIAYRTGLRPEHIERILLVELTGRDGILVDGHKGGLWKITEKGLAAVFVTQHEKSLSFEVAE
jgi:hypothetical protein